MDPNLGDKATKVPSLNGCDYLDEDDDFYLIDLCDTKNTNKHLDVCRLDSPSEEKSTTEVVTVKSECHETKNGDFCKDAGNKQYNNIRDNKNDIKTTNEHEGNDESVEIKQKKESVSKSLVPVDEDLEDYEDVIDELNTSCDNINGGEKFIYISSEDDSQELESYFVPEKSEGSFESGNEIVEKLSVFSPGVSFLVKPSLSKEFEAGLKNKNNATSKSSCYDTSSREKKVIKHSNDKSYNRRIKSATHNPNVKSERGNRKRSYSSNLTSVHDPVESLDCIYDVLSCDNTTSKIDSKTSPAKKSRTTTEDSVVLEDVQRSQKTPKTETCKESLQDDIERVLEMFPDLEEEFVRRRFRLLKSQYQDNIIERVIESIITEISSEESEETNISNYSSDNEYEADVQTAIGNPRINIQTVKDRGLDSVHPSLYRKGSKSGIGTKGKGPAKKKKHKVEKDSVNFDRGHDVVMDEDGWEDIEEEREVDESLYYSGDKLSVVKCNSCRKTNDAEKVVQCCGGHVVCSQCVEEEVKNILMLENQQMQFTCPLKNCDSHVPDSQTKRVLSTFVIGLLQDKFEKQAVASISKMENLH